MTPVHAETPSISVLDAEECDPGYGSLVDWRIDAAEPRTTVFVYWRI